MIVNSYCENNYDKDFLYSVEDVMNISNKFLNYAFNNFETMFPLDYDYNFDILLCDNDFIHNINKKYRNKNCPTDVITFALFVDCNEKIVVDNNISLGQIIISCDKVLEQAKENNVSIEYEFKNLLAHGILHLLGFDHFNAETLNIMLDLQNKMIEDLDNVKI